MAVDDTKQRVDSSSGVPSRAAEALTAACAESHQPAAASFGSRIQRCPVPSEKPSSAGTPSLTGHGSRTKHRASSLYFAHIAICTPSSVRWWKLGESWALRKHTSSV